MLEQVLQIIAVSVSQTALIFFKHVNVRVIVAKQVNKKSLAAAKAEIERILKNDRDKD